MQAACFTARCLLAKLKLNIEAARSLSSSEYAHYVVPAGPSPVNSYEMWPADVQAMRDLGVKVRRLLCSAATNSTCIAHGRFSQLLPQHNLRRSQGETLCRNAVSTPLVHSCCIPCSTWLLASSVDHKESWQLTNTVCGAAELPIQHQLAAPVPGGRGRAERGGRALLLRAHRCAAGGGHHALGHPVPF